MNKFQNFNIASIALALLIISIDLMMKFIITGDFIIGEMRPLVSGLVLIGRVECFKMALGGIGVVMSIGAILVQIAFVLLFFVIQKKQVNALYKHAVTLIVFGWIGNYLDAMIFSNGNSSYSYLDYLYIDPFGILTNLSSMMNTIGWILLFITTIVKFNELKIIFKKG